MTKAIRALWRRFFGRPALVSDEQRWRRLATAARVQDERQFGEWWAVR